MNSSVPVVERRVEHKRSWITKASHLVLFCGPLIRRFKLVATCAVRCQYDRAANCWPGETKRTLRDGWETTGGSEERHDSHLEEELTMISVPTSASPRERLKISRDISSCMLRQGEPRLSDYLYRHLIPFYTYLLAYVFAISGIN